MYACVMFRGGREGGAATPVKKIMGRLKLSVAVFEILL